ncbi:MAG: hypothetical protein AABW91_00635, partial [Nanoarchaeota archaeon]
EPSTFGLGPHCSIQAELRAHNKLNYSSKQCFKVLVKCEIIKVREIGPKDYPIILGRLNSCEFNYSNLFESNKNI